MQRENRVHRTFRSACNRMVDGYHAILLSDDGKAARQWLHRRCITDDLISKYRLGFGRYLTSTWISIPLIDQWGVYGIKFRRFPDTDENNKAKYLNYCPRCAGVGPFNIANIERDKPEEVMLVEGEFDAMVAEAQADLPFTVGLPGATFFKDEWLPYLSPASTIYICFDNDEAGRNGAARAIEKINNKYPGKSIKQVRLPQHIKDITSFIMKGEKT